MEGWIPTKRLLKITEFADKFCGNIEPLHRYIYLYFDRVLRVSMTDGCAVADLFFSKEFFPFEKVYKIPIQHLKGLLRGLKEEENPLVRMLALEEGLKIELENMTLNIESENVEKPEFNMNNSILFSTVSLKDFIDKLDFCSVQSMEGDLINFVSNNHDFISYTYGYNMNTYSYFGKSKIAFSRGIPYVTIRHLIKSLSLISDEKINLYLNENSIFIKGKGINIKICGAINPANNNINLNLNIKPFESQEINLKDLRKILNKIYTSLPSNSKVFLIFGNNSYILAKDKNTTITWKINMKFKYKYLLEINPRKLRSLFSRLKDNVIIELNDKIVLIKDNQKFLKIHVKEFSK
ncbi:hypothetical protein SAMN02745164_01602 [Marinitoga hydrogenitolerans DSM 16785]|uniref:Uncharacterized protein n=1 Tax=Marinitoga hydrogenitolerans (strain DSM 16785 / JCM 12826 / AT1271) TaxID=1122195 RepID=A0A1M4Y5W8_MARH1|nr:hypothetical protein [Marinitoga hydrogenitolerans]SHF01207.1 hypothetical protein SAMN02745164_01602 [Marinitoga hydrogenitolerans DSM 16785]